MQIRWGYDAALFYLTDCVELCIFGQGSIAFYYKNDRSLYGITYYFVV